MSQGPPGGVLGILGVVAVAGLIAGVVVTVCMVYRRGQKPHSETDNDQTDLPPTHKPAPPPPKKKGGNIKGSLTSEDIQVVHLGSEDEMQKCPLQPAYYDMAQSESTITFTNMQNPGRRFTELATPADHVTCQPPDSQQHCLERRPPAAYTPVNFLPQHPYLQPHPNMPMYTFQPKAAPPGPHHPYPFHNEHSV